MKETVQVVDEMRWDSDRVPLVEDEIKVQMKMQSFTVAVAVVYIYSNSGRLLMSVMCFPV